MEVVFKRYRWAALICKQHAQLAVVWVKVSRLVVNAVLARAWGRSANENLYRLIFLLAWTIKHGSGWLVKAMLLLKGMDLMAIFLFRSM
jgi:hypothetical protein